MVSTIVGKPNHHAIDNGDINSDVPVESNYDSIPDPDTTTIKSIDDGEMDHLLISMHSIVTKKNNHQYNGTANLWQITSNPGLLPPEPILWFQLSWGK